MGNLIDGFEQNNGGDINQETYQNTEKKLWNPKGFLILSVLFSFLPAAILYSLNYGRLGFSKKRNVSLAISFISFTAMVSLAFVISQGIARSIFYGLNIGAAVFMYNDQSNMFKNHVINGGRKASYLVPTLVSVVITAAILALIIYSINIPDQKLIFNGSELYYTQNVQKGEAEKLGAYLSEQGFFNEDTKVSAKIDKQSSTYIFSIIVDKSNLDNKELEQAVKGMAKDLSQYVFNNSKVDINLCNSAFKPLKTVPGTE